MLKTDGTADCVVRICSSKRDVIDIKIHRVPPEKKVCAHSSDFLQCVSIETQKMKTARKKSSKYTFCNEFSFDNKTARTMFGLFYQKIQKPLFLITSLYHSALSFT